MIDFFYDKTVYILTPVETANEYGEVTKVYTTVYDLKCKIQRNSGNKSITGNQDKYRYNDKLYCNYTTTVSTSCMIKDTSSIYWDIISIYSPQNRHMQIDLKESYANRT